MLDNPGFLFWPVGTGDSTTVVINSEAVFQIDIRHLVKSEDDDDDHVAIVDALATHLPKISGAPYLSGFALTHPDQDHIQGFENLLDQVTIGEIWFTPRVFREFDADLCDDAVAFKDEAIRRVQATIDAGGDPGPGNRIRLIGYDELLQEAEYSGFPDEWFTIPGHIITSLDGEDHMGEFSAFIHGPFKEENEGDDRNDTSLAMQIVLSDDPASGGALLFGDLKYPTIRKIFDVSKANGNEDYLSWKVLLAPHHCSKSVMYQDEDGTLVLKKDILNDFQSAQVGEGYIVSSSEAVPASNSSGDNPPHAKAKARYVEIVEGEFLCTHEDSGYAEPLSFQMQGGIVEYAADASVLSSNLSDSVDEARGSDETPTTKVGFGDCH